MALTLRVVGGLSSEEIARAFLVPVPTVQARITRAKKTIAAAWVPFELPRPASAVSAAVPTTTGTAAIARPRSTLLAADDRSPPATGTPSLQPMPTRWHASSIPTPDSNSRQYSDSTRIWR